MATTRLRLLVIEDRDDDYDLVIRQVRRAGYDVVAARVDCESSLRKALAEERFDAILSDYSLPSLDAPRALAIVKEAGVDVPFVIVSGTVDEETAVAAMRAGAHDFMSKSKLARLVPALEREMRETTERRENRKLRADLMLSDRLASVGALAAGVAHEINNPLAAVLANLEFALGELHALESEIGVRASGVRAPIEDACEAAQRVRFIVRDLRVFSRGNDEGVGPVDVHEVLESSLRMAKSELHHRARIVRDYGPAPAVRANDARLGQVFLNLLVNAAQAIPEGQADANEIRIVTRHEGARVAIEVHDTGAGIPADIAPRIFDPFFTTKPIGTGTGLGLAICHRIVTSLDGEIALLPGAERGTIVRVVLPVANDEPAIRSSRSSPSPSPSGPPSGPVEKTTRGSRPTIAVVDDDVMIARALQRMLGRDHEVITPTPIDLLAALSGGERFDAILCDLMMPDVTGYELYARIAAAAPDQAERVIFMTGGAVSDAASAFLARVTNPRIAKPFQTDALRALLRRVIAANGREENQELKA